MEESSLFHTRYANVLLTMHAGVGTAQQRIFSISCSRWKYCSVCGRHLGQGVGQLQPIFCILPSKYPANTGPVWPGQCWVVTK